MNAREQAQWKWDHVAKPLHSLGLLEDMIVKVAGIQETAEVRIDKRCALVFCADHGVVPSMIWAWTHIRRRREQNDRTGHGRQRQR